MYEEQAEHYLGFRSSVQAGLGLGNIATSAHNVATKTRLLTSAYKTYQAAKRQQDKQPEGGAGAQFNDETLATVIETLWNFTVLDVEATVRQVCFKVLKDSSVPIEHRVQRAHALALMGQVFLAHSQSMEVGLRDIQSKVRQQTAAFPTEPENE